MNSSTIPLYVHDKEQAVPMNIELDAGSLILAAFTKVLAETAPDEIAKMMVASLMEKADQRSYGSTATVLDNLVKGAVERLARTVVEKVVESYSSQIEEQIKASQRLRPQGDLGNRCPWRALMATDRQEQMTEVEPLEDCPCCSEPTYPQDFRTVDGERFCAWCDETGCPRDRADERAEREGR